MRGRHSSEQSSDVSDERRVLSSRTRARFFVDHDSITIGRLDKASSKILTSSAIHLKCDMCRTSFKVCTNRIDLGQFIVEKFDDSQFRRRRMSVPVKLQPLTVMFPPQLKRFVVSTTTERVTESITSFARSLSSDLIPISNEISNEIDSFDPGSMFTAEPTLCVGGFTENWVIPE